MMTVPEFNGGIDTASFGNGLTLNNDYDLDYRLSLKQSGTIYDRTLVYNDVNNIKEQINNLDATKSQSFIYDNLDRLTDASGTYGAYHYDYDDDGNRIGETKNTTLTSSFNYALTSNRLNDITGTKANTYTYDNNGNTLTKAGMIFTYSDINRMSQMVKGTVTANYQYDAKGQRVVKTVNGVSTIFIYDIDGKLIAEADVTGVIQKDYIYYGTQPLAMATTGVMSEVYYYHLDHLQTPQVLTNQAQGIVWQADYEAFGEVALTSNLVENNLRFPGQYFDAESGLYYNYFRYYDPEMGRYITSDPIGLAGGLNTYAYVYANPLKFYDPLGLECVYIGRRSESSREFTTTREELTSSTSTRIPGPRPLQPQDCFPVPGPDTSPGRIPRGFPCGLPVGQWLVVTDVYQKYTITNTSISAIGVYECTDDCGNVIEELVPINENFTTESASGTRVEVTTTPLF